MRSRASVFTLAALVLAAGCGQHEEPPMTVGAEFISAATSPTQDPNDGESLGAERTFNVMNTDLRVTVLSFASRVAEASPRPMDGGHWAGAEVRTCSVSAESKLKVSWSQWLLRDTEDGRHERSKISWETFPLPEYPFAPQRVEAGECVQGWVVFPVPDTVEISRVEYSPNDSIRARWDVPAE